MDWETPGVNYYPKDLLDDGIIENALRHHPLLSLLVLSNCVFIYITKNALIPTSLPNETVYNNIG
jgi:hypothetical protein